MTTSPQISDDVVELTALYIEMAGMKASFERRVLDQAVTIAKLKAHIDKLCIQLNEFTLGQNELDPKEEPI